MTNHRDTVSEIMDLLNAEYPSKFSTKLERIKVWSQMLNGFDRELILGAAYHLVSTCRWPPNIAQMREQCVLMSHGKLQNPTSSDAWEHVMERVNHKDIELTPFEKKALKQTGRTINELRQTQLLYLATDRARFSEAFDRLISKQHLERITLPEVKTLVARNAPALPAPATKQIEEKNKCHTCNGRGEVGGMTGLEGYDTVDCPDCYGAPAPAVKQREIMTPPSERRTIEGNVPEHLLPEQIERLKQQMGMGGLR